MTRKKQEENAALCGAPFTKQVVGYPAPVHAVCGLAEGHDGDHSVAEPEEEGDQEETSAA